MHAWERGREGGRGGEGGVNQAHEHEGIVNACTIVLYKLPYKGNLVKLPYKGNPVSERCTHGQCAWTMCMNNCTNNSLSLISYLNNKVKIVLV